MRARQEAEARRRAEEAEALAREQRGRAAAEAGVAKLKAHDLDIPSEEEQKSKRGKTAPKRPTQHARANPAGAPASLQLQMHLTKQNAFVPWHQSAGRVKNKRKRKVPLSTGKLCEK